MATYVKTQRGGQKLLFNGYAYRTDKTGIDKKTWRCEKSSCKGRAWSMNDEVTETTAHNHAPDPERLFALKTMSELVDKAGTSNEAPRHLIQTSMSTLPLSAASHLPSYNSIRRTIQRKRRREHLPYPNPSHISDIEIPPELNITHRGQPFLLYDSGSDDENRFLMFATEGNLRQLGRSKTWYADGTFKVCPSLFYQLFTMHAMIGGMVVPLVYVLLQNKSEVAYTQVLNVVKERCLELQIELSPDNILIDFEMAIQKAMLTVWPEVQLSGCFYHLCQALWRNVQHQGLSDMYKNDHDFRSATKLLPALAFVRPDDVTETFELIQDECPPALDNIYNYFEDNYIGRVRRGRRRAAPRYSIAMWNCHERVKHGVARTNNSVEGWHCAFQNALGCVHPTIYKLIEALRKEQSMTEVSIERTLAGEERPTASKAKYVQLDRRLRTLVGRYDEIDRKDYLRGVSYNVTF